MEFHPNARANFDEKGHRLLDLASTAAPDTRDAPPPPFRPEVHVEAALGPEDIRGPIVWRDTDRFGLETTRRIGDQSGMIVLHGPAHEAFMQLTEAMQRTATLRDTVSLGTVRDLVTDWIWHAKAGRSTESSSAYVLRACEVRVQDCTVVVPIFGLHVEEDVSIGHVVFRTITGAELSEWENRNRAEGEELTPAVRDNYARRRKQFAGRAAARVKLRAEPKYAHERALEHTELALAVLRLFSVGAFAPERPSYVVPFGRQLIETDYHFILPNSGWVQYSEAMVSTDWHPPCLLDRKRIREEIHPLLAPWSDLLRTATRTPMQSDALKSLLLYSRATLYRSVSEKLIHIFAALESLLLRNETEPITAAISDRLAFAVGTTLAERKAVARNVKEVYGFRSRFVHHATDVDVRGSELQTLETFLVTVSQFFMNLGGNLGRFATREQLLDALESLKFR